ncbi:hypothetical protein [Streptomyces sp. CAU 1734]|uniref:hypothetical protein n=1 Tax=Streptomyces sp. CAU 1734 TaxID=3140360 RepID=UPI003260647E
MPYEGPSGQVASGQVASVKSPTGRGSSGKGSYGQGLYGESAVRRSGRVALVAGTGTFAEGFDPLWRVPDELRLMRAVFTETAELSIHPESRLNPTVAELRHGLERAVTGGDAGIPPDVLVFYYSGHGVIHDEQLWIAAADSRLRQRATQLTVEDLVSLLIRAEADSPREIVVLLDFCFAGMAVEVFDRELARLRAQGRWLPVITVIAAVERTDQAQQLHFASSLAAALRNPPAGEQQPWIGQQELYKELERRMGDLSGVPVPVRNMLPAGESRAFPNPRYEPPTVRRPQEEGPGTGWAFCGRAAASRRIVAHLTSETARPGGLAVTGAASRGKSVLLDWVHTASCGEPLTPGPGAPEFPPEGCVDVLVDARGMPVTSVARKLAAHYRTGTKTDVPGLVAALAELPGPLRICVDSVEAAADEDELVGELLEPLGRIPGVRLVMAWSRVLPGFTGEQLALDGPEFTEDGDIARLVQQILCHRRDSRWGGVGREAITAVAEAVAEAAGGSWLQAYLFAIRHSPSDPAVVGVYAERSSAQLFFEKLESLDADGVDPDDHRWARDLLLPVAFGQGGGLPADGELWAAVVRASGRPKVGESDLKLLQELAGEFLAVPEDEMHGAGWRFERAPIGRYLVQAAEAPSVHAAFVRAMCERLPTRSPGSHDWSAADRYTRDHFPLHAWLAGVLDSYLDDPEFVLAMNAETLRRALIRASDHPDDKAGRVRSLCEQLYGTNRWDGHTLSRIALLAQIHSLGELAVRAAEWTSGWRPSLVERHPSAAVFCVDESTLLTATDYGFWRTGRGTPEEARAPGWSRLGTPGRSPVTTASVIDLAGRPCVFAGQIDGSAWIQSLDDNGGFKVIDGLGLNCRLVTCAQSGGGLLIAGTEGWQWREAKVTGAVVPRVGRRLGGAATARVGDTDLVAGMTATDVSVWRSDGEWLRTFTPPQGQALKAIAADSAGVFTGAGDGTVRRTPWSGHGGRQIATHSGPVAELRVRAGRHGRVLVSTGQYGDIQLTPLDGGGSTPYSLELGIGVNSADLSPSGDRVLVGTDAGVVDITL